MHDPDAFAPESLFDQATPQGRALAQELRDALLRIAGAEDKEGLCCEAEYSRRLMLRAIGELAAEPLTRLISMLNDAVTRRVIALACRGIAQPMPRWCWIALGSEGRQEQTLASDQDNGIVFETKAHPDAARAVLLPLAGAINEALAACGFPLCPGRIMAGNPECCLSMDEWRQRFLNWIIEGDPQALLNATIFFDLRPLYGEADLAHALAHWLALTAPDNRRFMFQMADNALRRKPPLGVLRGLVVEHGGEFDGTVDLKHNAATLFVDAARLYGLACGAHTSNTADRLRRAMEMKHFTAEEADGWVRGFYFIEMLRLENQRRCHARGEAMHNHLDPKELDDARRSALLDALHQARTLQRKLALDFLGGRVG